jgi:F-type H+-transporting ATPase subunit b
MNLFNQILNNFSIQISDLSVEQNLDLFESNLINIAILFGGVIYFSSNALSLSLSKRQKNILGAIEEAEVKLQLAENFLQTNERRIESVKQKINLIEKDSELAAANMKIAIEIEGNVKVESLRKAAELYITGMELKLRAAIFDCLIDLIIERSLFQLESRLKSNSNLHEQIIYRTSERYENQCLIF